MINEKWGIREMRIENMRNKGYEKWGMWEIVKESNGKCEELVRSQMWEMRNAE